MKLEAAASVRAEHQPYLEALGIPAPSVEPLERYLSIVARWNTKTNLTGAETPEERVRVLVADPWRAAAALPGESLIDVGSGNGSPGFVLALLHPGVRTTLLEPRARRWAFLKEAARSLGRLDVDVQRAPCEEYRGARASTVTLRGLALSVDAAGALATPGGEVVYFGGRPMETAEWGLERRLPLSDSELYMFRRRSHVSRETEV